MKKRYKLMLGDNITSLKQLPDNFVDSVVTDPPYGLNFMAKKWDYDVPTVEFWKEVYRVLKPGGHILSFGGTRTYHRMVVNIEDAGFEIRDQIIWIYGSGFPKSHNIGKAVDKIEGNEREVIGKKTGGAHTASSGNLGFGQGKYANSAKEGSNATKDINENNMSIITKGNSAYEGWGTALKPANEPICVARKPISEKTVAANMMKWGTGGINIEGCRVGNEMISEGRFPANIIFDEEAALLLDNQNNGASRFFYVAKVSKKERNLGLDGFEDKVIEGRDEIQDTLNNPFKKRPTPTKNTHPTVKPVKLMQYLIRLVTPENGIVLEPFMGSGSTGIAAMLEDKRFVGMEMDADYFKIAEKRIEEWEQYKTLK